MSDSTEKTWWDRELEYFQELTGEKRESELAAPPCSPARENVKKLGLAACYLRTAANFTEKGWLKEAYMEAEHAQRLLKDVIEAKPENTVYTPTDSYNEKSTREKH